MKLPLQLFDRALRESSSYSCILCITNMVIDEFAEMGCPSRDKDSMYFKQDGFPGDCDGGLHVSDVYEIEGVGFEGEGAVDNVVKLIHMSE